MDLSVLIPARNEMFLKQTVENILQQMRGDTEIIVVCDGNWPAPPIKDHERVHLIHYAESIGQRAATNEAARMSQAKYIMKCDAHCAFDEGFDVKLMADCEPDWTVVPRMYNLHAFDWVCDLCRHRIYQGPKPERCVGCGDPAAEIKREIVWQAKGNPETDFGYFNSELRFQYWRPYKKRVEAQGDIADLMCCVGACWFMHRERYWELEGLDEAHGSWGQVGVEIACKSWLSGGRQVVNKKTWFAHLFRTGPGFGFPYPNPGISKARKYSRKLWLENKWPKARHDLQWLLDKFAPVPTWEKAAPERIPADLRKGLVYYTDNQCEERVANAVRRRLAALANGHPIVSVSLYPIEFGRNIVIQEERGILTMFRQILAGLEAIEADIIFLVEHDILYHPSHFEFVPPRKDCFYYNLNAWKVCARTGRALHYITKQTSQLCACRELLLEHYRKRVARVEREGFTRRMGFEPGTHKFPRGVDNISSGTWRSKQPNIDIRHANNLTWSRWKQEQFRNKRSIRGWTEAEEVPDWGRTQDRFDQFLREVDSEIRAS